MFRKLWLKLKTLLNQGLQPKFLAWSVALGFWIGIFPIYGTATFLVTALAIRFKLNLPVCIGVSYAVTPVQLLLLLPFLRFGEWSLGLPPLPLDLEELKQILNTGMIEIFSFFSGSIIAMLIGWLTIASPIALLIYIITFQIAKAIKHQSKEP